MKRLGVLLLLLLAGRTVAADVVLWGHTGFDTGTTGGVVHICRPVEQVVGRTAVTLAAGNLTGTNAFVDVQAQDAIPGTNISFRTSGIHLVLGGVSYLYRISAKGSDSSITVLAGAAAPAESGTTTDWGFWNTTCFRQTGGMTTIPNSQAIAHSIPWTYPANLPLASTHYGSALGAVHTTTLTGSTARLWVLKDILGGGMAQENAAQHNGGVTVPTTARQISALGVTAAQPALAALHTRITFSSTQVFGNPSYAFTFALMRK